MPMFIAVIIIFISLFSPNNMPIKQITMDFVTVFYKNFLSISVYMISF